MRYSRLLALVLGLHLLRVAATAQTYVEIRQDSTLYNFRAQRGVPLSSTTGNPVGSDGRIPAGGGGQTSNPATTNQFQSVVSFGGLAAPTNTSALNTNLSLVANANAIGLPRGRSNNVVVVVLKSSLVGAPFLSRAVSFQFGAIIPVPSVDENGATLTNTLPTAYWIAEPHTTNAHTGAAYYWSRHAQAVFAIQPGPVDIVWKKAAPGVHTGTNRPPDYSTNAASYFVDGANYYKLYPVRYVASGTAVKPVQQMYWTEGVFRDTGKPVDVPQARVSTVNIIYNNNYPRTVSQAYVAEGQSFISAQTNMLQELRTLWYDDTQKQIRAYNTEGRVFVELLGDVRAGDAKQHLGFEIVDVTRQPNPADVTTELGERLGAFSDGSDDSALFPEPILRPASQFFTFQQTTAGTDRRTFYATRETQNQNDVLFHWMQEGVQGIRWPLRFVRYTQVWPADVARYSHYVRPAEATEAEAKLTAVPLPNENVPVIEYQDPFDRPRAKLTEQFAFYTFLDATVSAHRTLLRFTSGENVAFERVFSWLDVNLKTTNFDNTVATNLTPVANYINYLPAYAAYTNYLATYAAYTNYVAYTNYLAARSRGVNGAWKLYVRDDVAVGNGSIASWALDVVTTNSGAGTLSTNSFSVGAITINDNTAASPYPSTITVSGITNAVQTVRVKLNAVTHQNAADVDALLVGPNSNVCALMSDAGGNLAISSLNFVFDDAAAASLPTTTLSSGTYKPTNYDSAEALPPGATGPIGTSLAALLLAAPAEVSQPATPYVTNAPTVVPPPDPAPWPSGPTAPGVVNQLANVGDRIVAPAGEQGATGSYLAGYLLRSAGTSFHPTAYVDPLVAGFDAASRGAIIPVNAIPGANMLEVWWFRRNSVDLAKGFKNTYWPAVIGRYTLQWPASSREIVLASNAGSGGLGSLEAAGRIYAQNDPSKPGYNPNEEHALMLAGQAYALRDDLNVTTTNGYSSHPFVLLDYTESDGRPAMSVFKVLREKPSAGIYFDYITEAGTLLQAPMPLPLLAAPVEGTGATAVNYNSEPPANSADLPPNWNAGVDGSSANSHYQRFTFRDRKDSFWVYRGLHAGLPVLQAGSYNTTTNVFLALSNAAGVVNQPFTNFVHVSRRAETLVMTNLSALPTGLAISGLAVAGIPTAVTTNTVSLRISDTGDGSIVTNSLTIAVRSSGSVTNQGQLVIMSTNAMTGTVTTFTNRPPYLARSPAPTNSFTMRFYYKTQAGFDWPGIASPPAVGSIVPYLRPLTDGVFSGDPAGKTTPALDIVYRPTWPASPSAMSPGQTLTVAAGGLPAVRGQSSVQVLYQQSVGTNFATKTPSVALHDPTREKTFALGQIGGLASIPAGVRTDVYQGKLFFPALPPHLAARLWFDPFRGASGSLVFKGEFKDEALGEKYVLLNVLGASDLATVQALCPASDSNKSKWDSAIAGLATTVETFKESPTASGAYIVDTSKTAVVGATNLSEITYGDTAADSYALSASGPATGYVTLLFGNGSAFTPQGEPVDVKVLRVGGSLYNGELKVLPSANPLNELLTIQHTADLAARTADYEYDWRIAPPVNGLPLGVNAVNPAMTGWQPLVNTNRDVPRYTLGGAGIQVLVDNYLTMRYRPANTNHPLYGQWSAFTTPQLAEGWIKRVLAAINPFNQRTSDLFNNTVNTDASILTQAGHRWEGDVALNMDTINNYGLIEIYETVLRRGKSLSTDSGINYGPANDALLLAAGYLNDLYMMLGNEAFADAANPTIGIGTKDRTYGDIATSLFAFKGQVASLLDEELALLRGRDEFLQPGTSLAPVYNRLVWNHTRGIDSGEVIYALNYNILDQDADGSIGAADAQKLYPQGHGDAYGHYLTAMKGYYSLLMDTDFDWVPRIEAVTILGKAVSVDYQDERKFAAAAAAVARSGRQIFDLTWRQDYQSGKGNGWETFAKTRSGTNLTRYWGMDHWASRTGQGAYLNWIVGNAILPDVDSDSTHEGIQKVDRTTVPELTELPVAADALQTSLDNAEAGLTPLGLPATSIPFDLNPNTVVGTAPQTHFDQVNDRAKTTLKNALGAFDEAKDVTRLMRSEQDSLADFQATVAKQEFAYTNALIELYGTPYPDDIGAGKTYKTGYAGPDLLHYSYVETPSLAGTGQTALRTNQTFRIDVQQLPGGWAGELADALNVTAANSPDYSNGVHYIEYVLGPHGFFDKPSTWAGKRSSPGQIQQAISETIKANERLYLALTEAQDAKARLDKANQLLNSRKATQSALLELDNKAGDVNKQIIDAQASLDIVSKRLETSIEAVEMGREVVTEALPKSIILGLANGGDVMSPGRAAAFAAFSAVKFGLLIADSVQFQGAINTMRGYQKTLLDLDTLSPGFAQENKEAIANLGFMLNELQSHGATINQRLQDLDDAQRAYQRLIAEGDRIQAEREIFRQRAAAVIQGFRTRDAAFRVFRNEKLERYKTLFDLAARYAFMSAQAYDYETGQLGTSAGRDFVSRIIRSRALGVMKDGEPQYAGSSTGDPGLSSALAEMAADWLVLKGRLGFNNPDAYGTTVSLRTENLRILPAADGDPNWKDVLQRGRMANLLDDPDVKRHCLQIDPGNGLPVPGIVIEFSTTIAAGHNFFGKPLAAGDHSYSPSSFATKVFAVGIALEGYKGMDNPAANTGAITGSGSTSPTDPNTSFLDATAMSATPYVYLIPVGVDSMRSPPLGDVSTVRTWTVDDVTIPLPFNLGASDFSTKRLWQSADSLTEQLFGTRKHQAFRPVSSASLFSTGIYSGSGGLQRSQYTNSRLIGRSVWNSKWKVVIPGQTLLNNPDEGLDRFIQSVKDIKLNFVTYSYSGN